MAIEPGPSENFLEELGVSANLRALMARTARQFDEDRTWVNFDTFAYEAAEADQSFDLNEVFRLPQALGGVWSGEQLSLTGLGLLEAGAAPNSSEEMAQLVMTCVERKRRLRDDAKIGSEVLIAEYAYPQDRAVAAKRLLELVPGLLGGGSATEDGQWTNDIFRGALLEYRNVESLDDLRAVLQRQARDRLMVQRQALESGVGLGPVESAFEPPTAEAEVVDESDRLWRANHIRVFLSHLSNEYRFAEAVAEALREIGVDAFVAHSSIEPSQEWQDEIEYGLRTADVLVGLLHDGFSQSHWTQQEVGWALGRGIPTLMVRLGEDPRGFPGRYQAARGDRNSARHTASQIIVWLCTLLPFGPNLTRLLVASLREAHSYSAAKEAALRLDEIGNLSAPILDAIEEAYVTNNQIYPNHVAAPVVTRILQRHDRVLPPPPTH